MVWSAFTQWCFHYRQRLALELGESVIQDLRRDLFAKFLSMPMSFFNRMKIGSIISRFSSDAEAVRVGVQDIFFVTFVQVGQMLVAAALMLWYDWALFLVVLAMAPFLAVFNYRFRQSLSDGNRAVQESWSRVTAAIAESVTGIRVTQGFVRQEINSGLFADLIDDHAKLNLGVARTSGVLLPMLELNGQVFNVALLLLGGYRVLSPGIHMDFANLLRFFFLAGVFFSAIQPIAAQYSAALTAMAGAERVFRLLDTKPDWVEPENVKALATIQGRVEFRDVSFGYNSDRPALHHVNFMTEPGQTIALVGHTGSGKSSIINLITKFYLPTSGTVLIDGHDILTIQGDSIHRQMGMVSQQNILFTGTVVDNIRVGRPDATDEEVTEVVRQLDFLDLIGALPSGFATQVGERGAGLSLGQRQLICFARAMLAQPRILILDEATSSVDAMREARIQKALEKLLKGRTSFVVAHRLSTIRGADLVLVLDHGEIIERGTHTQLLAAGGTYAGLHDQFVSMSRDTPI
jgi:ATP-binding cassette subfamily B protein